jgi:hypothetical protein
MYPRKPAPHTEQIARIRRCLLRLRTQLRHRYDEYFEATKGRRECAFEVQLRHRLLESTREAVALAEACLEELRRQELMFYSPFKPGDRIVVDYVDNGVARTRGPYIIVDICPGKRRAFHYQALELTKAGAVHKRRALQWIWPRASLTIRLSELPVCEEAEWEAKYYSECAKASRVLAFEKGDLTLFEAIGGILGSRTFRRKDRRSA